MFLQTLPHRDGTDGFFVAGCAAPGPRERHDDVDLGDVCPDCGEPWLRPTNLPGRYRCVNCLHRFELASVCPNCGEHSTIVRMSEHGAVRLQPLPGVDAGADLDELVAASRRRSSRPTSRGSASRSRRCWTPARA